MLINTFIQNASQKVTDTHRLSEATWTLRERHHMFANRYWKPSNRSLPSQVTLSKQKKLKKRQIKNSFVECLVNFMVYRRFLPWFE